MFMVILKSTQTDAIMTVKLEGNAFTTEVDNEDLGAWIREYAEENGVNEASVSYEVEEMKNKEMIETINGLCFSSECEGPNGEPRQWAVIPAK